MIPTPAMQRRTLTHEGVRLSWLDSGGDGPVLLCLHALWMQAGSFAALADRLFPDWRVVAPDLRGHGQSETGGDLTPEALARDAAALIAGLGTPPAVVLGNSLGGTVAIVLAARHPELVRAIIVEEGGVRPEGTLPFLDDWRGVFPDRAAFARKAGPLYWSLAPSLVEGPEGVRLGPDVEALRRILDALQADRWSDWLATRCPALLVGGRDSRVMDEADLREIADGRPGVRLAMVDGGGHA